MSNRSVVLLAVFTSTFALAQQGPPRGPPPESLQACSGLASGAACGFTHHGQNLTGVCRTGPAGEALACAPEGKGTRGPHRAPPAEAVAACTGQADGAACSFTSEGRAMSGKCHAGPSGEATACRPTRGEGGGHRAPPPEATAACSGSSAGAACSLTIRGEAISGTCASRDGEALACRPERPPRD